MSYGVNDSDLNRDLYIEVLNDIIDDVIPAIKSDDDSIDYNKNGKHYFTINQINNKLIKQYKLPVKVEYLKWFCVNHCYYHSLKTGGMGKFKMAKCYEISEVIQNLRYKNFYIPRS